MKLIVKIRRDGERGLFATEDIKKDEFICILPIDYIYLDANWYTTTKQSSNINFRYGIICDILKTNINQLESFLDFYYDKKINCFKNLIKYIKNDKINIIGVSNPDIVKDLFIGHMINDGVDMSFLSENNYKKMSKKFSNVKVIPLLKKFKNRLGLDIITTKNIKKGEELLMTYGTEYWKKYSKKGNFIYNIKTSII